MRIGKLNPEDRLPPMILGGLLLAAGLFCSAWTSHPSNNATSHVLSGIRFEPSVVLIFMTGVVYIIDVSLVHANSAIAINTFVRGFFAAAFLMLAKYVFHTSGLVWAIKLVGFVFRR